MNRVGDGVTEFSAERIADEGLNVGVLDRAGVIDGVGDTDGVIDGVGDLLGDKELVGDGVTDAVAEVDDDGVGEDRKTITSAF